MEGSGRSLIVPSRTQVHHPHLGGSTLYENVRFWWTLDLPLFRNTHGLCRRTWWTPRLAPNLPPLCSLTSGGNCSGSPRNICNPPQALFRHWYLCCLITGPRITLFPCIKCSKSSVLTRKEVTFIRLETRIHIKYSVLKRMFQYVSLWIEMSQEKNVHKNNKKSYSE
jgi:hypothetical protein